MNILVCVKQVPDTTVIKIDPVKHTLIRAGVPSILNTFDTLYETAIICNGGKNVQLQTVNGDRIVINLEQYIQDEIMRYCYNN